MPEPGHIVWSSPRPLRPGQDLVLFLHGFGGSEADWEPAFAMLPEGAVGAALRGPINVNGHHAWGDFGPRHYPSTRGLPQLDAVASGVLSWLDQWSSRRVSVVGWSQGGALAVHLLRQAPRRFVAAAVVAGFVWDLRPCPPLARAHPPVWYGLGDQDEVIKPDLAKASKKWLRAHTSAQLVQIPEAGHILTASLLSDAMDFTATTLSQPESRGR